MSNDDEYEVVEVQVSKKIGVEISLDDLLNGISAQTQSIASGVQGAHAQVTDSLNRLGQLVEDLKGEVGQLGHVDPNVFNTLQRGAPPKGESGSADAV
jgi:hypothetical protein